MFIKKIHNEWQIIDDVDIYVDWSIGGPYLL